MAAGATYEPIATTTISGTSTGTVSFTSISSSYTDIVAIINGATTSGTYGLWYRFNNDSGSNYSQTYLFGNGTSAASGRESNYTTGSAGLNISTTFGIYIVNFMNYANTTTYKTALSRGNSTSDLVDTAVSLWRSTSAINRIDFAVGASFPSGNFASGSTITLYGIKAA
jgi:hypothetical protein